MRQLLVFMLIVVVIVAALPAQAQQQPQPAPPAADPLVVAPELFTQASQAVQSGNYARALLDYSLFILLNPTDSRAFFGRGMTYRMVGELDDALNDLSQAIALAPPVPDYAAQLYYSRADLYLRQNDLEAALDDLNQSLVLAPNLAEALMVRANVLAYQQRYDDALLDYNRLIDLMPNEGSAYSQRGELNLYLGNLDDALADLNRAIDIDPTASANYFNRALIHNAQADFAAALDDLNSAIDLNPQNGSLYLVRGGVHNAVDNVADAASDYLQWMEVIQTRRSISPTTMTPVNEPFVIEMGPGWVYHFLVDARAGQVLNVIANQMTNGNVDPLVVVVDAGRTPLIADDDSGGGLNAAILDYEIPADGEYTVLVSHSGSGANGRIGVIIGLAEAAQ